MVRGNQPTDGGNLIIEADDYPEFVKESVIGPYLKKLIGSRELLHNLPRYCLWLVDAPEEVLSNSLVADRLEKCRIFRLGSKSTVGIAQKNASTPHLFIQRTQPKCKTSIVVPRVSSQRREYIPMGFIGDDTIVSDSCQLVPNGTLYDFGLLESRMHMTWMRTVCGRLKSDYRYSRDLCYNTFPWPKASEMQRQVIENLANNILMAREFYPELTLADLYDPDKMPDELRKAHQELDLAVDRLYRRKSFENDEQRLHHLFGRYEKLVKGEDSSQLFNEE